MCAGTNDSRVHGVVWHREEGLRALHEVIIEMLPLHEQFEFEQFDIRIQIDVHHRIITDLHLVLNAELPGSRVEH